MCTAISANAETKRADVTQASRPSHQPAGLQSVLSAKQSNSFLRLIIVTKNFRGGKQINNSYEITGLSACQSDAPIGHGGLCPVLQTDRSKQEE